MRLIATSIDIEAPSEHVWSNLLAFDAYPNWNPFIVRLEGRPSPGERLKVRLQLPGSKPMDFRPRILRLDEGRELTWLGRVGLPGIFDGEHSFRLEPIDAGRVRFHQVERFRGLLAPLILRSIGEKTRAQFEASNRALKRLAESIATGTPSR